MWMAPIGFANSCRNSIRTQLPLDGLGLDFYHLSENLHRCRREVFGADDEPGRSWAEQLLHTFKHEG